MAAPPVKPRKAYTSKTQPSVTKVSFIRVHKSKPHASELSNSDTGVYRWPLQQ